MKPHHDHDCDKCRFLGSVKWEAAENGVADLYVCEDADMGASFAERATLIARTGSDGPEYTSCLISIFEANKLSNPLLQAAYDRRHRFGGSIAKRGETIEGSFKSHAYQDVWEEARPIKYDGELTPEVCKAIEAAWNQYNDSLPVSTSYGCLRWPSPDSFIKVDTERRMVIVSCAINLCD